MIFWIKCTSSKWPSAVRFQDHNIFIFTWSKSLYNNINSIKPASRLPIHYYIHIRKHFKIK